MGNRAKAMLDVDGRFYGLHIECPGCEMGFHRLPVNWCPPGLVESPHQQGKPHWEFNGNLERPTFKPSIRSQQPWKEAERVCHSFVTDGRIQFLDDCTHLLKGETVDLPEIPDEEEA